MDLSRPSALRDPAGDSPGGPAPARSRRRPRRERWELPGLAGVLLLAAVLYTWGIGHAPIHPYYSAAVRSMAESWRAFVFGGLDSSASISVDKVPGAFWPQALSVWLFGPHVWAVALPQVLEALLTIGVLHRTVRAWAGPWAALLAALALALTPVTVVLARGDIPDTPLTLLLVLAAGSLLTAVRTGRWAPLLLCALWVGLAFQAKMLQAFLVLPAFAVVYQLAAPGSRSARLVRLVAAGAVALAVSASWLVLVWLTPAGDRPWLDGTQHNSPLALVLGYNGLSRLGGGTATSLGAVAGTSASRTTGNTGWTMLFTHTVGTQISWLLPFAVLSLALGLRLRAGAPRTDPVRAGQLLWGLWIVTHGVVFALSNGNHAYYTAVLAPAIAAATGAGAARLWSPRRAGGRRRIALPLAVALTVLWAGVLDAPFTFFAGWLLPVAGLLGLCGAVGLWACRPGSTSRAVGASAAACVVACLLAPAVWATAGVIPLYAGSPMSPLAGPVGSNYAQLKADPASALQVSYDSPDQHDADLLSYLTAHDAGSTYLLAAQAAYSAEPLLRATTRPVLVMGGFTGLAPFPSTARLAALVAAGKVRYALLTTARPATADTRWVRAHCTRIRPKALHWRSSHGFTLYDCHAGT